MDGSEPAAVLANAWGISPPIGEPRHGPRRTTWRVGEDLWLASATGADADAIVRESAFLAAATPLVARSGIRLPRVVPTLSDETAHQDDGRAWRLCEHVGGEPVDPRDEGTWREVAGFVVRLDAALAALPHDLAVRRDGIVVSGVREIDRSSDSATLDDAGHRAVIDRAREFVACRAAELTELPVQILHGDCHTPNLLFTHEARPRIRGALDLEFAAVDPAIVELALPAANLLLDSGLPDVPHRLRMLWTDWHGAGGKGSYEALETALVLTRLHFCRLTRERFPGDALRIGISVKHVSLAMEAVTS